MGKKDKNNPGARVAARLRKIYGGDKITMQTVESIVNQETAALELLAVARETVNTIIELRLDCVDLESDARAAISKAEGI